MIASSNPTRRTTERPIDGGLPSGPRTPTRISRIPGVWPAELQNSTKYAATVSIQPEPSNN